MSIPAPRPAAEEVVRHVAARLQLARARSGWTQELLGDAAGVTFQQVQKYERATNRISSGRLYVMARALSVPVGFFFEGLDDAPPAPIEHDGLTLRLVRHFARLDTPLRRQLVAFVRVLASRGGDSEEER